MAPVTKDGLSQATSGQCLFDKLANCHETAQDIRESVAQLPEKVREDYIRHVYSKISSLDKQGSLNMQRLKTDIEKMIRFCVRSDQNSDEFALEYPKKIQKRLFYVGIGLGLPHHKRYDQDRHPIIVALETCLINLNQEIPLSRHRIEMNSRSVAATAPLRSHTGAELLSQLLKNEALAV